MADTPHFSPDGTYVLDDTVVEATELLRMTQLLYDLHPDRKPGGKAADPASGTSEAKKAGYVNPFMADEDFFSAE